VLGLPKQDKRRKMEKEVLNKLRDLTKELNDNHVVEDGTSLLGIINMHIDAYTDLDINRIIELWDNFIEDMRQQGIECIIRSPKVNGENGNGRKK